MKGVIDEMRAIQWCRILHSPSKSKIEGLGATETSRTKVALISARSQGHNMKRSKGGSSYGDMCDSSSANYICEGKCMTPLSIVQQKFHVINQESNRHLQSPSKSTKICKTVVEIISIKLALGLGVVKLGSLARNRLMSRQCKV